VLAKVHPNLHTGFVTRCPEGHAPLSMRQTQKQRLIAVSPQKICHACPRRRDCPVKLEKKAAYLRYDLPSLRCAVRRAEEHSPQFWEEYRWRAGIEGTNSHLKSDLGMGRLRVRGMEAVRLAVMMKVLGLNILRCGRALKARLCDSLAQFTGIFAPKSYPYACIDKLYSRIFGILKNFTLSPQKTFFAA